MNNSALHKVFVTDLNLFIPVIFSNSMRPLLPIATSSMNIGYTYPPKQMTRSAENAPTIRDQQLYFYSELPTI